jgi:hypothetical protein
MTCGASHGEVKLNGHVEAESKGVSQSIRLSRSVEKFLNEIGHDHSTAAVQMNAIAVKAPATHLGDLVGTLTKNENPEGVTIERKKSETREGTTRRRQDLAKHVFVDRNIADVFFSCDLPDDCATQSKACPLPAVLLDPRQATIIAPDPTTGGWTRGI